jgi:hypothetical protein
MTATMTGRHAGALSPTDDRLTVELALWHVKLAAHNHRAATFTYAGKNTEQIIGHLTAQLASAGMLLQDARLLHAIIEPELAEPEPDQ